MAPWIAVIGSEKRLHLKKHKEGDEKTDQTNVNGRILIMKVKGCFAVEYCRLPLSLLPNSDDQHKEQLMTGIMIRPMLSDGKISWLLKAIDP